MWSHVSLFQKWVYHEFSFCCFSVSCKPHSIWVWCHTVIFIAQKLLFIFIKFCSSFSMFSIETSPHSTIQKYFGGIEENPLLYRSKTYLKFRNSLHISVDHSRGLEEPSLLSSTHCAPHCAAQLQYLEAVPRTRRHCSVLSWWSESEDVTRSAQWHDITTWCTPPAERDNPRI